MQSLADKNPSCSLHQGNQVQIFTLDGASSILQLNGKGIQILQSDRLARPYAVEIIHHILVCDMDLSG